MDRLHQIAILNPEWAVTISEFVTKYPEFKKYLYLAPISPVIRMHIPEIKTLFECLIWYVCQAGVKYDYAETQLYIILPLIKHTNWDIILQNLISLNTNTNIQAKKRKIYFDIANYMQSHNITHDTITIADLVDMSRRKIGVGESCVGFCKCRFSNDNDGVEFTDMYFVRAYKKIYGTDNKISIKATVDDWKANGFGRIGNMMMFQIHHYS